MKKFLAMLLAMAMLLTMVSSCALADDAIALRVWVGTNEDIEWLDGVVAAFKAAHPEATFDISYDIVSEGDAKSKVLADPEAAADVFTFADDQFVDLVAAGALQEVVMNADAIIAANGGLEAGAVQACMSNGTLYAYPATADNGYFMFYNKAYFTEEDVQSMDRMLEIAAQNGKFIGMEVSGWYLYSFFKGAGLTMKSDATGLQNECNWNATDTPIKGVDVAQAIIDIGTHPGFLTFGGDSFVTGVKDGSVIAGVNGAWNAKVAEEAWGENYAAAKLPTYTVAGQQVQMGSFAGYKLLGVNPMSENVGYAMLLAEYMTNYESQVSRFEIRGQGPSNVEAAASDAVKANPAISALAAQSAYATIQVVANNYWAPAETLGKLLTSGNPDGTDLQTLLDNAVAGITAAPME